MKNLLKIIIVLLMVLGGYYCLESSSFIEQGKKYDETILINNYFQDEETRYVFSFRDDKSIVSILEEEKYNRYYFDLIYVDGLIVCEFDDEEKKNIEIKVINNKVLYLIDENIFLYNVGA